MKQYLHTYQNDKSLLLFLDHPDLIEAVSQGSSVFVQIFSEHNQADFIKRIILLIQNEIPTATIAGSTTVGEIMAGSLQLRSTIVTISVFQSTAIVPLQICCTKGKEEADGARLIDYILEQGINIAGVQLLTTPLTINLSKILSGMETRKVNFPFFGGGAAVYDASKYSLVFNEEVFLDTGIIAIVYLSDVLKFYAGSYLGWEPLTKKMTITRSDDLIVHAIDDNNAYNLYKKYLNIPNDEDFFNNVLEFPFLVERNKATIARVPFFVDENGSIEFIADVKEGETFCIGYGDPVAMLDSSHEIQGQLLEFQPEAILIFACVCRRFLMQGDINLEIEPFKAIAPTSGFFTFGEIISCKDCIQLLNSAIVIVGMKEGSGTRRNVEEEFSHTYQSCSFQTDPFSKKHNMIVSRLLHFIKILSSELEQANGELTQLSEIDDLTQLYNRMKLNQILIKEIKRCNLLQVDFSIIIIDIDYFKNVNDTYGHNVGDSVLVELSALLKDVMHENDSVGRWGGEEFLVILPETNIQYALQIAENLRTAIEKHAFSIVSHLTCSFGVTSYCCAEYPDVLIARADKALYEAKNNGRNRVASLDC